MPKFMVVFKSGTSQEEMDRQIAQVEENGGTIERKIDSIIMKGFSASMPDSYVQTLQANLVGGPIDYIEPDGIVTTQ